MTEYLKQVGMLSYEFSQLLAEALGLSPDALAPFYGNPSELQHRSKVSIVMLFFHSLLITGL